MAGLIIGVSSWAALVIGCWLGLMLVGDSIAEW